MEQYNEQIDQRIKSIDELQEGQTILVPRQVNGKLDMVKATIAVIADKSPFFPQRYALKKIYAIGDTFTDYYSIDECLLAEDESDDDVPF